MWYMVFTCHNRSSDVIMRNVLTVTSMFTSVNYYIMCRSHIYSLFTYIFWHIWYRDVTLLKKYNFTAKEK